VAPMVLEPGMAVRLLALTGVLVMLGGCSHQRLVLATTDPISHPGGPIRMLTAPDTPEANACLTGCERQTNTCYVACSTSAECERCIEQKTACLERCPGAVWGR